MLILLQDQNFLDIMLSMSIKLLVEINIGQVLSGELTKQLIQDDHHDFPSAMSGSLNIHDITCKD